MAKVIVTGGAGYIGSHTVVELCAAGHEVVCVDNLFNAHSAMWPRVEAIVGHEIPLYEVDLEDAAATEAVFAEHADAAAVVHFAARIYVGESVERPVRYFRQNLNSMLNVLDAMAKHGQRAFVFSSSCSVYGNAAELPVTEDTAFGEAESPYARTKQMGEHILRDVVRAHPAIQGVILRYFNPAGAHVSGQIGEAPKLEQTHLVPIIMEVATGRRDRLKVFGGDYPTRDGSCVRDFVHVSDLGTAHLRAVEYALASERPADNPAVFNLGAGDGVSVLEAIAAFESATGEDLAYEIVAARDGDVAAIYTTPEKAAEELDWQPRHTIADVMRSALAWERTRAGLTFAQD